MKPELVNLYLEANGITVTGNTDKYYRLSPDGIKEWSVKVPKPTEDDLIQYESQIPKKPKTYSPSEFRDLFTDTEQLSIIKAQDTDDNLKLLVHKLYTSPTLSTDGQDLINGVNYLVAKGLIDQAKADEILDA
jgi:hypothetical protein